MGNNSKIENIVCNAISNLLKNGRLSIGVNIEVEHAELGDGRWNVSKTYAIIDGNTIDLQKGNVDITIY